VADVGEEGGTSGAVGGQMPWRTSANDARERVTEVRAEIANVMGECTQAERQIDAWDTAARCAW